MTPHQMNDVKFGEVMVNRFATEEYTDSYRANIKLLKIIHAEVVLLYVLY